MKRSARFFVPALLGLSALAASPLSLTDEVENYRQLQAMPRERRVALLANMGRFDKLDSIEQAKIRKLNDQIASKDPIEQLEYRSLMRRYELWVNGLTEVQKEALRAAEDPEARFELARKYRNAEQKTGSAAQRVFGIRTGYFNLTGPFEAAQLLRIWHGMTSAERYNLEDREPKGRIEDDIREYGKAHHVKLHPFPPEEAKHYDALLDANPDFKKQLTHFAERVEMASKKNDPARPKGEVAPTHFKFIYTRYLTEFRYFEDHKPRPVSQVNLEKFASFCPTWFLSMLDPLSADDARNYLTIIYRQLFPEPAEINADWQPAQQKAVVVPGRPRPNPKRPVITGPL